MISDILNMFWFYSKTSLKSRLQYKADAILTTSAIFLREASSIIVIYFTLLKFNNLNGWNMDDMLFLFSMLFLTYSLTVFFFAGLRDFYYRIIDGAFDRMLIRPRGVLFQLMSVNSDWLDATGHGVLGIILFFISTYGLSIKWNAAAITYFVLAIFGGVLIQGAIHLFICSLMFYIGKTENIKVILYWNMRKFAGYPISIFHKYIQSILVFIIPFAFVNYFPAQFFLRKPDLKNYPELFIYITPVVGIVLYILSYVFWRFSLRFYKSIGN